MSITTNQRNAWMTNLDWMLANSGLFGYDQVRPFQLLTKAEMQAAFTAKRAIDDLDCTASIIESCYITGLKDPGGFSYNGRGNTETMLEHLPCHYTDPKAAMPGAIVIFNADMALSTQHAAVVLEAGTDPEVWTHGGPGIEKMPLSWLQSAFKGSTVFLSPGPVG
jgi:hypothetical protein